MASPNTARKVAKEKIRRVMADIVDAERSYAQNLHLMTERLLVPCRLMVRDGYLENDVVLKIFSNVEAITNFHDILLAEVDAQNSKNPDDASGMAEVFFKYAPFLKMYTLYVNGYDRCCDTIDSLKGHRKFMSFLKETRNDKQMKGNNMMSFLIMPVQRLPVYEVLLERLLSAHKAAMAKKREDGSLSSVEDAVSEAAKAAEHAETKTATEKLETALAKIHEIAEYINENKRRAESRSKMLDLRSRITGAPQDFQLVTPSRKWIKDGELSKLSTFGFKKSRRVILFSDILLWCTPTYVFRGYVELARAIMAEEPPAETDVKADGNEDDDEEEEEEKEDESLLSSGLFGRRATHSFEILHPKKAQPLVLIASSVKERSKWVKAIRQCIKSESAALQDINLRRASVTQNMTAEQRREFSKSLGGDAPISEFLSAAAGQKPGRDGMDQPSNDDDSPNIRVGDQKSKSSDSAPANADDADDERLDVHKVLHGVLHDTFQATVVKQLDQCIEALQTLTQEDIDEMYLPAEESVIADEEEDQEVSMRKSGVPIIVRKVIEATSIMLGTEPYEITRGRHAGQKDYWRSAKALIRKSYFLRILLAEAEKKFKILPDTMALLKVYITNPLLQPKAVADVSFAAGVLWNWVRANYSAQSGVKLEMIPVIHRGTRKNRPRLDSEHTSMASSRPVKPSQGVSDASAGGSRVRSKSQAPSRRKRSAKSLTIRRSEDMPSAHGDFKSTDSPTLTPTPTPPGSRKPTPTKKRSGNSSASLLQRRTSEIGSASSSAASLKKVGSRNNLKNSPRSKASQHQLLKTLVGRTKSPGGSLRKDKSKGTPKTPTPRKKKLEKSDSSLL